MLHVWRPTALLVIVTLLIGGLLTAPSFAQSEPQYHYVLDRIEPTLRDALDLPAPAASTGDAALDQARTPRQYLPLLRRGPAFATLFGSSANPETFEVTAPGISFPRGTTRLYIDARFTDIRGIPFRTEAILPDGVRLRDTNRTATRLTEVDRYYICRVPITQPGCGANEQPLNPGIYTVEMIVNNEVLLTPQAEIRQGQ